MELHLTGAYFAGEVVSTLGITFNSDYNHIRQLKVARRKVETATRSMGFGSECASANL